LDLGYRGEDAAIRMEFLIILENLMRIAASSPFDPKKFCHSESAWLADEESPSSI
jgi:hypothetical protein